MKPRYRIRETKGNVYGQNFPVYVVQSRRWWGWKSIHIFSNPHSPSHARRQADNFIRMLQSGYDSLYSV